jgi:hypothetical protein
MEVVGQSRPFREFLVVEAHRKLSSRLHPL